MGCQHRFKLSCYCAECAAHRAEMTAARTPRFRSLYSLTHAQLVAGRAAYLREYNTHNFNAIVQAELERDSRRYAEGLRRQREFKKQHAP